MPGIKVGNEYAAQFGRLYEKTPKAVFAAIAYSLAFIGASDDSEEALARVISEWRILNENGIIPQKAPKGKP